MDNSNTGNNSDMKDAVNQMVGGLEKLIGSLEAQVNESLKGINGEQAKTFAKIINEAKLDKKFEEAKNAINQLTDLNKK